MGKKSGSKRSGSKSQKQDHGGLSSEPRTTFSMMGYVSIDRSSRGAGAAGSSSGPPSEPPTTAPSTTAPSAGLCSVEGGCHCPPANSSSNSSNSSNARPYRPPAHGTVMRDEYGRLVYVTHSSGCTCDACVESKPGARDDVYC